MLGYAQLASLQVRLMIWISGHSVEHHEMNVGNSGYLTNRLVRETPEDRRRTYAGTPHSVVSLHSFYQMMLPDLFITTHNGASNRESPFMNMVNNPVR